MKIIEVFVKSINKNINTYINKKKKITVNGI